MASSGDIRAILSPARFNTLPSDTQSVLVQAWNTQTGQLKAELEKVFTFSQIKTVINHCKVMVEKKNQLIFLEGLKSANDLVKCKISVDDPG